MPAQISGSQSGTVGLINSFTAASASGVAIGFVGIPSGAKRITVMLNGVQTNGTSYVQIQVGSGSFASTGYSVTSTFLNSGGVNSNANATTGFIIQLGTATQTRSGQLILSLLSSNVWTGSGSFSNIGQTGSVLTSGVVSLAGTLDRVQVTTVNGTDSFNSGTINILYE